MSLFSTLRKHSFRKSLNRTSDGALDSCAARSDTASRTGTGSWRLSMGPSRRASRGRMDDEANAQQTLASTDAALRAWLEAADGEPHLRSETADTFEERCHVPRRSDGEALEIEATAACSMASSTLATPECGSADFDGSWATATVGSEADEAERELLVELRRLLEMHGLPHRDSPNAAVCCARLLLSEGAHAAPEADEMKAVVHWLNALGTAQQQQEQQQQRPEAFPQDSPPPEELARHVVAAAADVRAEVAAAAAAAAAGAKSPPAPLQQQKRIGLVGLANGSAGVDRRNGRGAVPWNAARWSVQELAAAAKAAQAERAEECYGQLVVLGYREFLVRESTWHPVGKTGERLVLTKRAQANGVRLLPADEPEESLNAAADSEAKGEASAPAGQAKPKQQQQQLLREEERRASHVIQMHLPREEGGGEARVWYGADENADLFQLGRLQCPRNDFVVRGPLHQSSGGKVCGPVSRYALRISCTREGPDRRRCRLFAGGFGAANAIALAEGCPKWRAHPALGGWDGATTFGVRFWKPEVGEWREVTVNGAVHEPRVDRLDVVGPRCEDEDNLLTDGTVVDIGGIQLLFESWKRMATSAATCPEEIIAHLRRMRPQCPVMMHTIQFDAWQEDVVTPQAASPDTTEPMAHVAAPEDGSAAANGGNKPAPTAIPTDERGASSGGALPPAAAALGAGSAAATAEHSSSSGSDANAARAAKADAARAPWVFPACGHMHTYAPELSQGPCPMCRKPGPFTPALFQWVPAIDREAPTVVFNPCGHVASEAVARFWSSLPLPNNAPPDAVHRAVCPHCAKPLRTRAGERPFTKILWQADEFLEEDHE